MAPKAGGPRSHCEPRRRIFGEPSAQLHASGAIQSPVLELELVAAALIHDIIRRGPFPSAVFHPLHPTVIYPFPQESISPTEALACFRDLTSSYSVLYPSSLSFLLRILRNPSPYTHPSSIAGWPYAFFSLQIRYPSFTFTTSTLLNTSSSQGYY